MRSELNRWAIGSMLSLAAAAAFAQGTLSGVRVEKSPNGMHVLISGQGLSKPKASRVNGGTSYLLHFDAKLAGRAGKVNVNSGGLQSVNYSWFSAKPPRVSVHLKIDPSVDPTISEFPDGWEVLINDHSTPVRAAKIAEDPDAHQMDNAIAMLSGSAPEKKLANEVPESKTLSKVASDAFSNAGETFPAEVPPITDAATKSTKTLPVDSAPGKTLVTLDFTATDVVAIIKTLAMQSGVNIVTAPDVSPADKPLKLSISLSKVTVEDALNLMTAMAGLKYALVGNTFIVTKSESFNDAMRRIAERDTTRYVTRVIGLRSGEGEMVKNGTLKALPPGGKNGWYEIIVPGSNNNSNSTTNKPAGLEEATKAALGSDQDPKTGAEPKAPDAGSTLPPGVAVIPGRSYYVLLVGEAKQLSDIEGYIEELDSRISTAFSVSTLKDVKSVVVPIYSGKQDQIMSTLQRFLKSNPRSADYSISATSVRDLPENEESTTVLLMMGPPDDMESLRQFASAIDEEMCRAAGIQIERSVEAQEKIYEAVNLNYIEPKLAEFDLKSRVRGLHVTVLPDAVTPGINGEAEDKKAAGPQDQNPASQSTSKKEEEQTRKIGHEPMKLMLRGTREQIRQAKEYLALVDIAPKQVAVEMRVMDMTRDDVLKAGLDWNLFTGGALKILRLNNSQPTLPTPPSNVLSATLNGRDVTATLDSITTKSNLIARPNGIAMDGRSTNMFVGDTIRYIESIQSTQNGVSITAKEIKVGVNLNLMPRIGSNGSIVLNIEPTVSFLRGFTNVPGGGQLPQTSDRTFKSSITVQSGDTIAIGGLIQDQDVRDSSGVPILKDLPIVGNLFKRSTNTKKRTEVVIFLTARTIDGPATANNNVLPIKADTKGGKQ